jgi:hypothetical protein
VTEADDIGLSEAPFGSALYAQALRLREATLRKPLGLTLSAEELSDDAHRRHFCAVVNGSMIGSVSFKRLGASHAAAQADGGGGRTAGRRHRLAAA